MIGEDASQSDDEVLEAAENVNDWEYDKRGKLVDPQRRPVRPGLSNNPSVGLILYVDSMFTIPEQDSGKDIYFMLAARLTGSGMGAVLPNDTYKQSQNGIVRFESALRFEVPLPEVLDASGAIVGWDTTDAAMSQLPYALKIAVYCRNDT